MFVVYRFKFSPCLSYRFYYKCMSVLTICLVLICEKDKVDVKLLVLVLIHWLVFFYSKVCLWQCVCICCHVKCCKLYLVFNCKFLISIVWLYGASLFWFYVSCIVMLWVVGVLYILYSSVLPCV